jgi:hypothetical protein
VLPGAAARVSCDVTVLIAFFMLARRVGGPERGGGGRGRGRGRGGRGRGGRRRRAQERPWGGDMDVVQHVAIISRVEYEAGLAEAL